MLSLACALTHERRKNHILPPEKLLFLVVGEVEVLPNARSAHPLAPWSGPVSGQLENLDLPPECLEIVIEKVGIELLVIEQRCTFVLSDVLVLLVSRLRHLEIP